MRLGTLPVLSVASLASAALINPALAQGSKEWSQCMGGETPTVDVVVDGCTAVIQAGQDTPDKLAVAFNNRGVAYRFKGEYDRALEDYNQAIRLNPNSASHYNNRGIIYRLKGEYERAIIDYDEAIWLKADYAAAFYNRAVAYTDKGEYDKAIADFDVVLGFDAKNALALYGRGVARLKIGQAEAGSLDVAAAKAINPQIVEEFAPPRLR